MARDRMLLLELHSHKSALFTAETRAPVDRISTCCPRAVQTNNSPAGFVCLVDLPGAGSFLVLLVWLGERGFWKVQSDPCFREDSGAAESRGGECQGGFPAELAAQ